MQFSYACVKFKVGSECLLQGIRISCVSYLIPRYGPIYRLLANSRFLQILNISSLMSCHTIFLDFMDSNNHFSSMILQVT